MSFTASFRRFARNGGVLGHLAGTIARQTYDGFRAGLHSVDHRHRRAERLRASQRAQAEEALGALVASWPADFKGTVLVDSMWDNPNWWLRYSLLRAALGLAGGQEIGVQGYHGRRLTTRTLNSLGFSSIVSLHNEKNRHKAEAVKLARELLAGTRAAEDILQWQLPDDFPPHVLYDTLMKGQKSPVVDLHFPGLVRDLADALAHISAAADIVERISPDLVVTSHSISVPTVALLWAAIRRGIRCVVGHGEYGLARYWKVQAPQDLSLLFNVPTGEMLDELPSAQAEKLALVGGEYLRKRLGAETNDIGAVYAFQRQQTRLSRTAMCNHFGWSDDKPVVAVYSMSWFDYPHTYGEMWFRDPLDWVQATVEAVCGATHVNWLLRPHPCDLWYGSLTLADLLPKTLPSHVGLAPLDWNGAAVMDAVDGMVTMYGTAGIEYAGMGKPVLVSVPGWYGKAGFVRCPRSRQEYLELLGRDWWSVLDLTECTHRARLFVGWHFCCPDWQGGFVMRDDSEQSAIYQQLPAMLAENRSVIEREVATIREWWASEVKGYHSYKMKNAGGYALSNLEGA